MRERDGREEHKTTDKDKDVLYIYIHPSVRDFFSWISGRKPGAPTETRTWGDHTNSSQKRPALSFVEWVLRLFCMFVSVLMDDCEDGTLLRIPLFLPLLWLPQPNKVGSFPG